MSFRFLLPALALLAITPAAWAQTPPPGYAPPPAGYAPPPAGYAPPPAGYALPPGQRVYLPYGASPPALPGPRILAYQEGAPLPAGYHPEMRVRTGLLIGGGITFVTSYALAAVVAVGADEPILAVPILGPFVEIGRLGLGSGSGFGGWNAFGAGLLIVDGLGQIAGATMVFTGLASKKKVLVRDEATTATVRVTPLTMGQGGTGLGLVGTW